MMLYSIAGLKVSYEPKYGVLQKRAKPYAVENTNADFNITAAEKVFVKQAEENPSLSCADHEYATVGTAFFRKLIEYDGFLLHSSAVVLDGRAFCFSAPSGTGKSTHTSLWLKEFGDRAFIINDDKPAIRLVEGLPTVFGTPFSGKNNINVNTSAPLGAICFLEQAKENKIVRLNVNDSLYRLLDQTIRPRTEAQMDMLLKTVETVLTEIPVFLLSCDISHAALETSIAALLNI